VLAGSLSEEGLLLYLRALQTLLPLLPVSEGSSRPEVTSDSEDDDDAGNNASLKQVRCINTHGHIFKDTATWKFNLKIRINISGVGKLGT